MAIAPSASSRGEIPRPPPAVSTGGTGVGGGGAVCTTGGATSATGSTHPGAGWAAAAATAAVPHSAAAGAPALMTDKAAHGSICWEDGSEEVAAAAPVELTNIDPATSRATAGLKRRIAIPSLLAYRNLSPARYSPNARQQIIHNKVARLRNERIFSVFCRFFATRLLRDRYSNDISGGRITAYEIVVPSRRSQRAPDAPGPGPDHLRIMPDLLPIAGPADVGKGTPFEPAALACPGADHLIDRKGPTGPHP